MYFEFKLVKKDRSTRARTGLIKTPHGTIKTPAFSPVATQASVKTLDIEDLSKTKTQVVLGNAYHLYLHPGLEVLKDFNGFTNFMSWSGPSITDSGGYQVSFLWNRNKHKLAVSITDKGMYFRSHIDGTKHLLSPEISVDIQRTLAADIIMSFDQPLGINHKGNVEEMFSRTLNWEERTFKAWEAGGKKSVQNEYQALFGIIQGGLNKKLSRRSLKFILEMDFPGIAAGGETIGKDPYLTAETLEIIANLLPDDKPLHALGLGGGPEGIFAAVEAGVDIFDNSSITRIARTGLLYIYPRDGGKVDNKFRIDIKKSTYLHDKKPVSKVCSCYTCTNFSRAYLHHLMVRRELLGPRLATIHNVHYINDLMQSLRNAINNSDFQGIRNEWLS